MPTDGSSSQKSTKSGKVRFTPMSYVTDENGIVIFDSKNGLREGEDYSEYNDVFLARKGEYGVRATRSDQNDSRTTVFYIAAPVYDGEKLAGTLTVSRPETAMAPFAEESRKLVVRSSLITAGIVFLLGAAWGLPRPSSHPKPYPPRPANRSRQTSYLAGNRYGRTAHPQPRVGRHEAGTRRQALRRKLRSSADA